MKERTRFGYVSAQVSEEFCGYYAHFGFVEHDDEEIMPFRDKSEAEEFIDIFLHPEKPLEDWLVKPS